MSQQGDDTTSEMSDTSYSFFDIEIDDDKCPSNNDTENAVINESTSNDLVSEQPKVMQMAANTGAPSAGSSQIEKDLIENDLSEPCETISDQSGNTLQQNETLSILSGNTSANNVITDDPVDNGQDCSSDEDDTIPLSELKVKIRAQQQRESSTDSEMFDDDLDLTYRPSKKDLNSSDSENNMSELGAEENECNEMLPILSRPKKRKRKKRASENGQKKTTKNKELQRALSKSAKTAQIHKIIKKYHTARLEKLLSSNGLKRIPISADGNCFINAVLVHINDENNEETMDSLRSKIADHLHDHYDHYRMFRSTRPLDEHNDKEQYLAEVEMIRNSGTWDTNLADCLPLAVANIMKRPIKIYSSKIQTPVIDVEPDLSVDPGSNNACIYIACTAVRGQEHYDAVKQLDLSSSENEPTHFQTTPQNKTSEPQLLTPHKQAKYRSPCRRKLFRKRTPHVSEWKRNKRKTLRNKGLSYKATTGVITDPRAVKDVDCSKCRFKCSSKVSEEDRQALFSTYWALEDYGKQRSFLCQHVTQIATKDGKRKMKTNAYYFMTNDINHRVCKKFFLKTLNIGKKTIEIALKSKCHGTFVGKDKRGMKSSVNKTPAHCIDLIHEHIRSFPIMESHYSRAKTRKQYLSADLNIKVMYSLFKEKYFSNKECPVKESMYRKVFCESFNLSFHKPKRDQCSTCTLYSQRKMEGNVDEDTESSYRAHQQMKEWAREEKNRDKEKAKKDKTCHVATFDLEAVLSTPCSLVGELYYKRKLSCYNLSFYSLSDQKGTCYIWDESQGGRGCSEIGSCVLKQINAIANQRNIKEITLYSDTCGGQNRNQFMASGLLYALKQNPNLEKVNQKFFESGHSQMESDSIHSAVENAKKKTQIFVPSQWATVISLARRNKPYTVIPLRFDDFFDLKELKSATTSNMKVDSVGNRVNWLRIKWVQVRKELPRSLFVNYGFDPDQFLEIRVTRGRLQQEDTGLTKLFQAKQPISVAKKNDLLSLCRSKIIPEEYHSYYQGLITSKSSKDRVPDEDNSDYEEMDE